jgi:hypothetical protein
LLVCVTYAVPCKLRVLRAQIYANYPRDFGAKFFPKQKTLASTFRDLSRFRKCFTGELACKLPRKMEYADLERECEELIAQNIPAAMPMFMNADGRGERLLITHIDVDNFKFLPCAYMLFLNA